MRIMILVQLGHLQTSGPRSGGCLVLPPPPLQSPLLVGNGHLAQKA